MVRVAGDKEASALSAELWLLVSDLDDTILASDPADGGDSEALARFADAVAATPNLLVVLNSSRPRESVLRSIAERKSLRRATRLDFSFDGLITAMGTELLLVSENANSLARGWEARFAGWNRAPVDRAAAGFLPDRVTPHADELQGKYKASFAVPREVQPAFLEAIKSLDQPARIVVSGATDVDIIPPNAGKGEATLYVASLFGVDPRRNLIVAGDSANDLEMFKVSRRGIVVGNARAELVDATDPSRVFHSELKCSAGVLDGLNHWGVLTPGHKEQYQ